MSQAVALSNDKNREWAYRQAVEIEKRKQIETTILHAVEALIEFPTSPNASASNPSPADLAEFNRLLHPFTPQDFSDLIDERRCDKKCGYVFCPNPIEDTSNGAKLRLVWRNDACTSVPANKYDTYCSKACERRTMFVKIQLDDEPAWRNKTRNQQIRLLYEEDEEELVKKLHALAIERMDSSSAARKEQELLLNLAGLMLNKDEGTMDESMDKSPSVVVKDRVKVERPRAPTLQEHRNQSLAIEGYVPGEMDPLDPFEHVEDAFDIE